MANSKVMFHFVSVAALSNDHSNLRTYLNFYFSLLIIAELTLLFDETKLDVAIGEKNSFLSLNLSLCSIPVFWTKKSFLPMGFKPG